MTESERPSGMEAVVNLPPHEWDSTEAVSYETAQEAINEVIGCHTAALNRERRSASPDQARIEHLRAEIAACVQDQRGLNPRDRPAILASRDKYSHQLAALRAELQ